MADAGGGGLGTAEGTFPWPLLLRLWTLSPSASCCSQGEASGLERQKGLQPGCGPCPAPAVRGTEEESVVRACAAPDPPRTSAPGACGGPRGGPRSRGSRRDVADPAPSQWYCPLPRVLGVSVLSCCQVAAAFVTLMWAGKKAGFPLARPLLLTRLPWRRLPTAPRQAGPLGLPCPARWPLRVSPAFAQMLVLALASFSSKGSCRPQNGTVASRNKCSWGWLHPLNSPSSLLLALDL